MRWTPSAKIAPLLNEIVNKLVAQLDIRKIVLFGSHATGAYSKDSDLDLFIVANVKEKGISRYALVSKILEPRKMPIDIIIKTPGEIKQREKYFDPFLNNIQLNGKVLYEKKI
jgi:predicted nucleotidyltransferase